MYLSLYLSGIQKKMSSAFSRLPRAKAPDCYTLKGLQSLGWRKKEDLIQLWLYESNLI
jgi:hypothetical protein